MTNSIIRTDIWGLAPTPQQKQWLELTQAEYRAFCRALIGVVYTHYPQIAASTAKQGAVEKLIHKTTANPHPKYAYFGRRFYKFPSYLRRAAIDFVLGQVSSFVTRYRDWQSGNRTRKDAKPPRLNPDTRVYPCLYKNQCIKFNSDYTRAKIKVFLANDWKWIEVPITTKRERHLFPNTKMLSSTLVVKENQTYLSVPFQVKVNWKPQSNKVCGVDLGINTAAVASIVDSDGVIYDRFFIHDGTALDKRDKHLAKIRRQASQTMGKRGSLHKGFARIHYRKAAQINKNLARTVARRIYNFATQSDATTIVLEDLKGWKPKGGKKRMRPSRKYFRNRHAHQASVLISSNDITVG